MKKLELLVYNTYFVVQKVDPSLLGIIEILKKKFQTYSYKFDALTKRTYSVPDKGYYTYDKHRNLYRFTINILKDFILLLKVQGVTQHDIKMLSYKHFEYKNVKLKLASVFKLRDYQVKYNAKLKEPGTFKFVELQAGRGKSLIAMSAIADMGVRTAMILLPAYIDKWIIDIKKYTSVTDDEIYVIQGLESIQYLINNPNNNYKFFLLSMRTISNYIKDYEDNGMEYVVNPDMLFQTLGIGILLSDESHQEFYALFKALLYLNPIKVIGLSATMHSSNKEINKMYNYLFPEESRIKDIVEIKKIANCFAVSYNLKSMRRIKFKTHMGYNHILYEQSVMRNSLLLRDYTDMILSYIRKDFLPRMKPGQKALIFGASIKMCNIIYNYCKKQFPNQKVVRFIEDDTLDDALSGSIICSNVLKAGTAIDIPGLITVLQTVSMSTSQGNEQNIGRLREIEGVDCNYYYFYTNDIPQQRKHSNDRLDAVRKVCKNVYFERYSDILRTF